MRRTVTEGALISSFGSVVTTCVIGHGLLRRRREWSDVLAEPLAALVERADRRRRSVHSGDGVVHLSTPCGVDAVGECGGGAEADDGRH